MLLSSLALPLEVVTLGYRASIGPSRPRATGIVVDKSLTGVPESPGKAVKISKECRRL